MKGIAAVSVAAAVWHLSVDEGKFVEEGKFVDEGKFVKGIAAVSVAAAVWFTWTRRNRGHRTLKVDTCCNMFLCK